MQLRIRILRASEAAVGRNYIMVGHSTPEQGAVLVGAILEYWRPENGSGYEGSWQPVEIVDGKP